MPQTSLRGAGVSRRGVIVSIVVALVVPLLWAAPGATLEPACTLPVVEPEASPAGLEMGIFATETAPSGAAESRLLDHLDDLSGGDRSRLTIHLFSHYRGTATDPGVVEHESDVLWFANQGFPVELTVPYRVPIGDTPDPEGYVAYLETVVSRLGAEIDALMVTNEVNIDFWEGPSDGIHPGALDALIVGVPAARSAIDAHGFAIDLGFKWGYRHPSLSAEQAFWTAIGDRGGAEFVDALDFVGLDLYAFDFYVGDQSVADYTLQALQELRACFLPLAGIGMSTSLRITESGAPTSMWGEAGQALAIEQAVGTAFAHSASLNVDAWRQWGLYCGPPPTDPTAIFHCTGLLREDGSRRPAYELLTQLVAGGGAVPDLPPTIGSSISFADPSMTAPFDIAAGIDGNLWFTNSAGSSIGRITPQGFVTSFAAPGVTSPRGITRGPDGNLWFVHAGAGGSVARITAAGVVTSYPVGVSALREITAGPDGNLWFTGGDDVVGRITVGGAVTRYAVGPAAPDAIVTGPDGRLWFTKRGVVDPTVGIASGGLFTITTDGVVEEVIVEVAGNGIGGRGLVVGADGHLWFARRGRTSAAGSLSDAIQRISTLGETVGEMVAGGDPPQSLSSGPDGTVWSTTVGDSALRILPGSGADAFRGPGILGDRHEGIVEGPDGAMWFTNTDAGSIGRIAATRARTVSFTAHYSAQECTTFTVLADAFGATIPDVASLGVSVLVSVAQAGRATPVVAPPTGDGPCAVTVTLPIEELAAVSDTAAAWGVTPDQLVAAGAPLIAAIIYALAFGTS